MSSDAKIGLSILVVSVILITVLVSCVLIGDRKIDAAACKQNGYSDYRRYARIGFCVRLDSGGLLLLVLVAFLIMSFVLGGIGIANAVFEKDCQKAGYADKCYVQGDVYCFSYEDGIPILTPFEAR